MKFLSPWYELAGEQCVQLNAELTRELPEGHALKGVRVICLARRQDRDDVLFKFADDSGRFAEVHLTWQVERESRWPRTIIYASGSEWLVAMKAHHAEHDA